MTKRHVIWFIMFVGAASAATFGWRRFHAPLPPLEVSFWYWHQPFRLSSAEVAQLQSLNVRQLFVRAGTFCRDGSGVRLTMPQVWQSGTEGLDIHLVFNFGYDVVRHFDDLSNDAIASAVCDAAQRERRRAERSGVNVVGVQLDFDSPTRLLPQYADLLRQLRSSLIPHLSSFSITALPTWFTSPNMQQVINAVDFYVPQFYEARIPKTLNDFATISNLKLAERGLRAAGRRGGAFYVGLPAYGHALIYDANGKLLGTFRDLSVRDAVRHPSFKLARAFPADAHGKRATPATYVGEDIFDLLVLTNGCHVLYDVPTPALITQHLALINEQRPRRCKGVILFRYPEPDEVMTLPLPSIAAALRGKKAQPQLRVRLKTENAPWELIETRRSADRAPIDLTVSATNVGNANSFLAPDAVTLILHFDRPGLDDVEAGDFDAAETFLTETPITRIRNPKSEIRNGLRSSPHRANLIQFRKFHLAVGETAKARLRVSADGATKVWGTWRVKGAGGFDVVSGEIEERTLSGETGDKR